MRMTTVICENGHYIAKLRCEPVVGWPMMFEDFYDLVDGMEEQMKQGRYVKDTRCPICNGDIFDSHSKYLRVHTTDGIKPKPASQSNKPI